MKKLPRFTGEREKTGINQLTKEELFQKDSFLLRKMT